MPCQPSIRIFKAPGNAIRNRWTLIRWLRALVELEMQRVMPILEVAEKIRHVRVVDRLA